MEEKEVKEIKESKKIKRFSKQSILISDRYRTRRDLLNILLLDNKIYSYEEVDKMIDKFMKGSVK